MAWPDEVVGVAAWVGSEVRDAILAAAGTLREPSAPGLVSIVLVLFLVGLGTSYAFRTRQTLAAVGAAISILRSAADATAFQRDYVAISGRLRALSSAKGRTRKLGIAWHEYEETLEEDPNAGTVHNSVRPSTYFNREDLGLEDGFWRHLPALFVSVGLFLTFLGLVAALDTAASTLEAASGSTSGTVTSALTDLLSVASAKFIMSLTGLLCSILFTIELRIGTAMVDGRLLDLCDGIEARVRFRTAEGLLSELVRWASEQNQQLKALGPELVAQLGRPLQEAVDRQSGQLQTIDTNLANGLERLGDTIGEGLPAAIEKSLQPILERLESERQTGTQQIADDLSGRLTAGMKDALDQMSRTLQQVGHTLTGLADRMDQSAGSMSGQIDAAVAALAEQIRTLSHTMSESTGDATRVLNEGADRLLARMEESLQSIRDNTARSGEALEQAAATMQEAAKSLATNIEEQGREASEAAGKAVRTTAETATTEMSAALGSVADALQSSMPNIITQADRFAQAFQSDLVAPLTELRVALGHLRQEIDSGTAQSARHANAVANSAASIELANTQVSAAAHALSDAATPMAGAAGRIEESNRELRRAVEGSVEALDTMLNGIRAPQEAVLNAVRALADAVDQFSGIVGRYEDIDRSLGSAFEKIRAGVQSSVSEMTAFSEHLNQEYGQALTTLRSVVQQIEPYRGPTRRTQ
ncbi:MAG: hypothetical protein RLO08_13885 [Parvibaculaceae bacterium]